MGIKYISLFAGIGGFDLGFEQAGLTCVLQVEKNKYCLGQLRKHWPDVPRLENVKDVVTREKAPAADLICGGFPCQDISIAGRRAGLAGERSGLWFEFLRVITDIRPQWVVIENVPGLLSSNGGRDMGTIVGGLAELRYWWAYRVLNAEFFGVSQRRRRVFIVASLTEGLPQKVLFELESSPWDTPPSRETGTELAPTVTARIRKGGFTDPVSDNLIVHRVKPFEIHGGSKRKDRPEGGFYVRKVETSKPLDTGGLNPNCAQGGLCFVQNSRDELRLMNGDGQIAGAISSQVGMKQQNYIANIFNGYTGGPDDNDAQGNHSVIGFDASRGQHTGDIAAPLRVNGARKPGVNDGKPDNMCVSGSFGVRRLTPLECERLQGFPDNWTAGQSDAQRYRQLGNAVAVPVARWLGERILTNERMRHD